MIHILQRVCLVKEVGARLMRRRVLTMRLSRYVCVFVGVRACMRACNVLELEDVSSRQCQQDAGKNVGCSQGFQGACVSPIENTHADLRACVRIMCLSQRVFREGKISKTEEDEWVLHEEVKIRFLLFCACRARTVLCMCSACVLCMKSCQSV